MDNFIHLQIAYDLYYKVFLVEFLSEISSLYTSSSARSSFECEWQ